MTRDGLRPKSRSRSTGQASLEANAASTYPSCRAHHWLAISRIAFSDVAAIARRSNALLYDNPPAANQKAATTLQDATANTGLRRLDQAALRVVTASTSIPGSRPRRRVRRSGQATKKIKMDAGKPTRGML